MKKTIVLIIMMLVIPIISFAQTRVKADDIIEQVNKGKAVRYKNAEIIGDLNFTSVKDVELYKKNGSTKTYSCHVRCPISFINCIFRGDLIAYFHDDKKKETHNAVFHDDVDFGGCEFSKGSAFKYVKFLGDANFENTKFQEEALFKYTKFSTKVSYSKANFYGEANFKYTKFPKGVSFANAGFHGAANFKYTKFPEPVYFEGSVFRRSANFKYTKFPKGVSFENVGFHGATNFKYTKFYEPLNFDGVVFDKDADFKYTKIDGKSFTMYLLKRKK